VIPEGKVRDPFKHEGKLYVTGGGSHKGNSHEVKAYELVPVEEFKGSA
jgi:hypothetical protein